MSKRRSSERGAGESSGRASKLQCPGISGNNAKRAGPFILGKEAASVCTSPKSMDSKMSLGARLSPCATWDCAGNLERYFGVSVRVVRRLCVYARLRQECEEFS